MNEFMNEERIVFSLLTYVRLGALQHPSSGKRGVSVLKIINLYFVLNVNYNIDARMFTWQWYMNLLFKVS